MNTHCLSVFIDELSKIAKVTTTLLPHQSRVVERLKEDDQPGLIAVHNLGSGKTLTSIAAQDELGIPTTVVLPASLQENYRKEIEKHTKGGDSPSIVTLQRMARSGAPDEPGFLIVDEAHRLRDPNTQSHRAIRDNKATKRLLMTASPFYNRPFDLAPLVNIAAGSNVFPNDQSSFDKKYISEEKVYPSLLNQILGVKPGVEYSLNLKKKEELQGLMRKWVDYHLGDKEGLPDVHHSVIEVPMTPFQLELSDVMMKKAPLSVRLKIKAGLPPSKSESRQLNSFLTASRQIANTTAPFSTRNKVDQPKIDKAFENLKSSLDSNDRAKAVVYSNYLEAGVTPFREKLESAGIPYGEFTGDMPKKKRDEMVKDYNDGKIRTLLISSAGGEGLDLKGTRLVQLLEPHWNEEKLRQVAGRGVRYHSHAHLPKEERNVEVQTYLSTRPVSGILERLKLMKPGFSTDQYMHGMSKAKADLNQQFRDLLGTLA